MKSTFLFILLTLSMTLSACAPQSPIDEEPIIEEPIEEPIDEPTEPIDIVFTDPVETLPRDNNFEPAFSGQTRSRGTITSTPYAVELITSDLVEPWGVDVLPDGRLIITEKRGTLRILNLDNTLSSPIAGFPALNTVGQGGLLDVAVSPNFESDATLFFTLSLRTNSGSVSAVAKATLDTNTLSLNDVQVIHRADPSFNGNGHFGSRMVIKNNALYVSTGDRQSFETRNNVQLLNNGYGKILRMTFDGDPITSNPFYTQGGYARFVYALGLRNTQGLALHPNTSQLYASDMGPRGGDEINLIEPSNNYGWPIITYGSEYNGQRIGQGITTQDGLTQPIYYWDPSIAPSGMIFYDSNVIPEWENNLFVAALRGSHLARLVIDDDRVVAEERLLSDLGERFRDVSVHDGVLFTITDSGRLYRIRKE